MEKKQREQQALGEPKPGEFGEADPQQPRAGREPYELLEVAKRHRRRDRREPEAESEQDETGREKGMGQHDRRSAWLEARILKGTSIDCGSSARASGAKPEDAPRRLRESIAPA